MAMFLKPVEEKEIIDIVNECKNKISTDYNEIDMKVVKRVIHGISWCTALIYHFKLVNFLTIWKQLELFLCTKLETKATSQIIDLFLFSHSSH